MIKIRIAKIAIVVVALLLAALAGAAISRSDGEPRPTPTPPPSSPISPPDTGPSVVGAIHLGAASPGIFWLAIVALVAIVVAIVIAWLSSRDNPSW